MRSSHHTGHTLKVRAAHAHRRVLTRKLLGSDAIDWLSQGFDIDDEINLRRQLPLEWEIMNQLTVRGPGCRETSPLLLEHVFRWPHFLSLYSAGRVFTLFM